MAEFGFEGGYTGDRDFASHFQERQDGLPRVGNVVPLPQESELLDEHDLAQRAQSDPATQDREIRVGATVWLELSRSGPFKVVGLYDHPLGAHVPAHHQHDPDNHFERVRVNEDLWLCQDTRGVVHILAGGSLTTVQPVSHLSRLSKAAAWLWSKREAALWIALAGLAAKALLG